VRVPGNHCTSGALAIAAMIKFAPHMTSGNIRTGLPGLVTHRAVLDSLPQTTHPVEVYRRWTPA